MRLPQCGTAILFLSLAIPVSAQFSELVSTDDGKQLWFTSPLLLKGVNSSPYGETRLYRFRDGMVELIAERGALAPQGSFSSSDGVSSPSVSGNGSVLGFTYNNICRIDASCTESVNRVELRGRETLDLGPGNVQISRSGRWALLTNVVYDYSQPMVVGHSQEITLIDLVFGGRTKPQSVVVPTFWGQPSAFALTSDGSMLVMAPDLSVPPGIGGVAQPLFGLWKAGQVTRVPLPAGESVEPFAVSDDAGTVFAYAHPSTAPFLPSRMVAISMGTGKGSTIHDAGQSDSVFMGASNNGQRVLFKLSSPKSWDGPAFVWDSITGSSVPLPLAPGELATGGTMSGDGSTAFVATTHARIVRFDVASRTASSLFPQLPYCEDPGPVAGGSLARLRCPFLASSAAKPGQFLFKGEPMPLIYSIPGETGVQIPWQWDNFSTPTLSFAGSADSIFQPVQELSVYAAAPEIVPDAAGIWGIKMVKGDWSGLVTSTPLAGDLVYIYMTGLGWPEHEATTGVPASDTPNPILFQLSCRFLPQEQWATPLFAGLAPGMLGIYQAAFRLPSEPVAGGLTGIECALSTPVMTGLFGPGFPLRGLYANGSVVITPLLDRGLR